jgi:hypothetical protein
MRFVGDRSMMGAGYGNGNATKRNIGYVGPLEATRRARVRGARLARLTDAERTQLRAAEQRVAAAADDRDAATVVARLTWLTDFADRSSAPDFTRQPLYAYPRNAVVAAAPDQDRDRWLADPTSASGCADYSPGHRAAWPV